MPKAVIVLPEAEADVETAFDWYESRESGLGRSFVYEIKDAQLAIVEQPEIYPLRFDGFRRYLLRRFPYAIYYKQSDRTVIMVAVFHSSRHPSRLRSRLKSP